MTFALALVLASLDGGRHGQPFALHGVGVPVWEQYRRMGGPDSLSVSLEVDGGSLRFSGVRQGCNADGGGCVFAAPGVFISRVPGVVSPSFSPVWFSSISPTDPVFDVRFALLEAAADGGLHAFVARAGGDNGPEMDPYFPPGVDGLVVHLTIQADSPMRAGQVVNATCTTAASTLREELRSNRLGEATADDFAIPVGAQFSWGLVDAGTGTVAFSIFANQMPLWRWALPHTRLSQCGNADDGGYSDGVLDLSRLVPVLYVGWGTFVTPQQTANLTMGFGGHGPQFGAVPTTTAVGQVISLPIRLIDGDGRVVVGPSTRVDVPIRAPEFFPQTVVFPGLASTGEVTRFVTPTLPQLIRAQLEIDNPWVAVEHVITVLPNDAGVADAGVTDSGVTDSGVPAADGGLDQLDLVVGCGCSETNASLLLVLVALLGVRRRR